MKKIKLSRGEFVLVDDEDYDYLNQFKWHTLRTKYAKYATTHKNGKKPLMHRMILNAKDGEEVDHKDHNGLNNQRNNIRICTSSQNKANRTPCGKSKYLGVWFRYKNNKKYIKSSIRKHGIYYDLGTFCTEEKAAKAYDDMAIKLHGEFANLNFK